MEGPSLVILREEIASFAGRRITDVSGTSKQDLPRMEGKIIKAFKSWGKHFLICFDDFTVKVHFLMFGSCRINEIRESREPRMSLILDDNFINFYSCAIHFIEGDLEKVYDWKLDIMSPQWEKKYIIKLLKNYKDGLVCDVLLDQNLFVGVGNIIKNEVLFNLHIHPETRLEQLKPARVDQLTEEAREYSFNFYKWKKLNELHKHWQIYKKKKCPRCGVASERRKTGLNPRTSYFCNLCQVYE